MSILIWAMVAVWHFAVLVPDRFWDGIIGAFLAALLGALASGVRAADSRDPARQSARSERGVVAASRSALGLIASYLHGLQKERTARVSEGRRVVPRS